MNEPPAVKMSVNEPLPILISSTPPSHAASVSKRCRNDRVAAGAEIAMDGDVRSAALAAAEVSGANAEFGGVSALVVTVAKLIPPRTDVDVQPAGNAGAVTPSKFS